MSTLGTLQAARDGGWNGSIFLMAREVKVRLVPNDNQDNPKAPAYRIFAGEAELGAFWQKQTRDENPRDFLSGDIDFPGLESLVSVAAFFSEDGKKAKVVWSRKDQKKAAD